MLCCPVLFQACPTDALHRTSIIFCYSIYSCSFITFSWSSGVSPLPLLEDGVGEEEAGEGREGRWLGPCGPLRSDSTITLGGPGPGGPLRIGSGGPLRICSGGPLWSGSGGPRGGPCPGGPPYLPPPGCEQGEEYG